MIGIITVCYNSKDQLIKTIKSLRDQSSQQFEYIIVDGNSNDGTIDIINNNKDLITSYITEKDDGIYDAMNKGLELSNCDYITYLNADDTFDNNFIKTCYEIIKISQPDYIYSSVNAINGKNKKIYTPKVLDDNFHFDRMPFPHPGLVVKKQIFIEIGLFDLNYRYAADLDWILKMTFAKKYIGIRNDNSFVNYSMGGVGNSFKSLKESIEIYSKYNNSIIFKIKSYIIGYLKLVYIKIINEN